MFLVGIPLNTTALPGEEYPVAATVIMNDEVDTWVGYRDFTVLAENDESNVVVCVPQLLKLRAVFTQICY